MKLEGTLYAVASRHVDNPEYHFVHPSTVTYSQSQAHINLMDLVNNGDQDTVYCTVTLNPVQLSTEHEGVKEL